MGRKRVLMWVENNSYPEDGRVRREATALVSAGYHVTVVCPRRGSQPKREVIDGVSIARYPEVPDGSGMVGFVVEYLVSMFWTLVISVRLSFARRFDVIHAHNPPDTFALVAAPFKLLGTKFVFDHHDISPEMYNARFGDDARPVVHKVLLLMERITFALADQVIATNGSYREIAITRGKVDPDDVTVVRNGPELERVKLSDPDPELSARAGSILAYVGEMGPQDGVDHLVRAVGHLVRDLGRTDVLCLIMGDGDAVPHLRDLVAELDLGDHVEFNGWVSGEPLMKLLSTADVCIDPDPSNPYNDRCSMIKMSEYMALGKPIVAYDLPEHRVTAGEAALYATANDPLAMAICIDELLKDEERRRTMGQIGRTRVREQLAWNRQVPQLLTAYDRLFAQR